MKYEWRHTSSLPWMQARKTYLTASDIRKLWPKTKTGRDRKVTDLDYLQIYFEKSQEVTEKDCISSDWAARGHILEPYAVKEYNNHSLIHKLYHWDDCLIFDEDRLVAYSPDALSVDQTAFPNLVEISCKYVAATSMGEVKSYNPAKHIETAITPLNQVEERIQIAVAMAISPTIELGSLILYNPEISCAQLVIRDYTRESLSEEIDTVNSIIDRWVNFDPDETLESTGSDVFYCNANFSIDYIYEQYNTEFERMNTI